MSDQNSNADANANADNTQKTGGDTTQGTQQDPAIGSQAAADARTGFDAATFGEAMKNPEIYSDGKLFGAFTSFDEAAKGIKELRGQVRQKTEKAPDSYDFSKITVEGHPDFKFDPEHPLSKTMLPLMKESGLSQERAAKLAPGIFAFLASMEPDPEKEMQALGEKGPAMIDNVKNHVLAKAPAEMKAKIENLTKTADGVDVLNWMLNNRGEMSIPTDSSVGEPGRTAQSYYDEAAAYKKQHEMTISTTPAQRNEYDRLMRAGAQIEVNEENKKKNG